MSRCTRRKEERRWGPDLVDSLDAVDLNRMLDDLPVALDSGDTDDRLEAFHSTLT